MAIKFKGDTTVAIINSIKKAEVDTVYRCFDSGVLLSNEVINHGDFVSWDGTEWIKRPDLGYLIGDYGSVPSEIVYFDVDPSDPPSGIYEAIGEALANNKEPVIKNDGAVYFYSSTGTDKYIFVGGYDTDVVNYTTVTVSDNDSVVKETVDTIEGMVFPLYYHSNDGGFTVADKTGRALTKTEIADAYRAGQIFMFSSYPASNTQAHWGYCCDIDIDSDNTGYAEFFILAAFGGDSYAWEKYRINLSSGTEFVTLWGPNTSYSTGYSGYYADGATTVSVSTTQNFNSTQKAKGRDNIGAASASDVIALQSQVSSLSDVSINAVKYIPQKTLKLGPDLFDLSDASYDTNKWSVSGDAITFTSSAISTAEFDTGIVIPEGKVYYAEVTVDNYDVLTNLFTLKVGATGPEYDIYDGTTTPRGSLIGNGGTLRIVPGSRSNLNFTIRMVLSKVVSSGESRTLTLDIKNVSCGNADGKIVDAKWNVAIGPRENCFANNVNATRCIAVGSHALENLKSGWQNIAIGTFAMCQLKKGDRNTALGPDSIYLMEEGTDNVAIGRTCLAGPSSQPYSNFRADKMVTIGNFSAGIRGYGESESVYIGYRCASYGIGSKCVCIGANIPSQKGAKNRIAIGHGATNDVDNTTVIGNSDIEATKVYGDLIVEGTDHVKRRIVFNNDNTVTWEVVS